MSKHKQIGCCPQLLKLYSSVRNGLLYSCSNQYPTFPCNEACSSWKQPIVALMTTRRVNYVVVDYFKLIIYLRTPNQIYFDVDHTQDNWTSVAKQSTGAQSLKHKTSPRLILLFLLSFWTLPKQSTLPLPLPLPLPHTRTQPALGSQSCLVMSTTPPPTPAPTSPRKKQRLSNIEAEELVPGMERRNIINSMSNVISATHPHVSDETFTQPSTRSETCTVAATCLQFSGAPSMKSLQRKKQRY